MSLQVNVLSHAIGCETIETTIPAKIGPQRTVSWYSTSGAVVMGAERVSTSFPMVEEVEGLCV